MVGHVGAGIGTEFILSMLARKHPGLRSYIDRASNAAAFAGSLGGGYLGGMFFKQEKTSMFKIANGIFVKEALSNTRLSAMIQKGLADRASNVQAIRTAGMRGSVKGLPGIRETSQRAAGGLIDRTMMQGDRALSSLLRRTSKAPWGSAQHSLAPVAEASQAFNKWLPSALNLG
jgi:hypothetical protein